VGAGSRLVAEMPRGKQMSIVLELTEEEVELTREIMESTSLRDLISIGKLTQWEKWQQMLDDVVEKLLTAQPGFVLTPKEAAIASDACGDTLEAYKFRRKREIDIGQICDDTEALRARLLEFIEAQAMMPDEAPSEAQGGGE